MNYVDCTNCGQGFSNNIGLDIHMIKVHGETLKEKIERLQMIVQKEEDKKNEVSEEEEDQTNGEEKNRVKDRRNNEKEENPNRGTKREMESVEEEIEEISSEYTKETYGNKEDIDDEESCQGITFKGKSRKYLGAYNKLREKMAQGAEFKVNGTEMKIKSTPKQKPMKVEVTTKDGVTGQAQLQMHTPGKKGATVQITRASKEGFDTVKIVANEFIETFLNILLKGLITGEEDMKEYIKISKEEKFKCDKCEKDFSTNHGLKIHLSWHTKNKVTKEKDEQRPINRNSPSLSFTQKTNERSICEWCDEKFTGAMKYQAINALLTHKKKCTNKPKMETMDTVKRKCDACEYNAKNEKDMKSHMRDAHLNISSSTSPPPKKKRASKDIDKVECITIDTDDPIDTDDLVSSIEDMDIQENGETEEEKELKKRSLLMDKKVEEINRKHEKEEIEYMVRKKIIEGKKLEIEEDEKVKQKEALNKRKYEEKKIKMMEKKHEDLQKRGISKLPEKFHGLVGEYKNHLAIPGNGSCQASSKAAILLQDPRKGPQLAIEENSFIVEHWKEYFINFFQFPHTLKLRGGKTKICHNDKEFLEFLVFNPEVSYMWADHHQLAVTCNLYNTTVQVLTIDEFGEGSLLHETITPDPKLAPFSLLPPTKPNGEKMDVPEVWLLYTNGNHYDALLKDDHPLMTDGSMKERGFSEEPTKLKYRKTNTNKNEPEFNKPVMKECDYCEFTFFNKASLEEHKYNTGHGFWQIDTDNEEKELNKVVNKQSYSQITKGERISKLVKEVLEFELTNSKNDDNAYKVKFNKEINDHNATKKYLKTIEDAYKKCKAELRNVEEEKERLKIKNNDLKSVNELNKVIEKESSQSEKKESMVTCVMCEYPFKTITALNKHILKHKKPVIEVEMNQNCGICASEFSSNNEFRRHIKIKHTMQYNCNKCDFQGSSNIILTKHINLKHRAKDDQVDGTFKCQECDEQFSSFWSLNNHMRDHHVKTKICKHFKEGRCRFSANECWDKHELVNVESIPNDSKYQCTSCGNSFNTKNSVMTHIKKEHPGIVNLASIPNDDKHQCQTCGNSFISKNSVMMHIKKEHPGTVNLASIPIDDKYECNTCANSFNTKNSVMMHRKREHPDKVKPCRDEPNCTRKNCWYAHKTTKVIETNPSVKETREWVSNELDGENEDFQLAPIPTKPPINEQE